MKRVSTSVALLALLLAGTLFTGCYRRVVGAEGPAEYRYDVIHEPNVPASSNQRGSVVTSKDAVPPRSQQETDEDKGWFNWFGGGDDKDE